MTELTWAFVGFLLLAVTRASARAADRRWWIRLRALVAWRKVVSAWRAYVRLAEAFEELVCGEADASNPLVSALMHALSLTFEAQEEMIRLRRRQ